MDSAMWAACEITVLVAFGAMTIGGLIGFAWGRRTVNNKELVSEEDILQLFPTSDPFEWDHLPVTAEQEQAL